MLISSLSEGSGYYTGGPGPHEGSGTSAGVRTPQEVRSPGCSGCRLLRDTCRSWTFPSCETGLGPLPRDQDSGPQGSGCLDVVKDNYKGPCLDTARGGTPVLGYRQWPPGPPRERYEPAGGATIAMCFYAT